MEYIIRQERLDDRNEVYDMVKRAFSTVEDCDGDEQDYLNEVRERSGFIPELSLVAQTLEGKIVGQVVLSETNIQMESKKVPCLVLSPLSVHPGYFRQGIARALVTQSAAKAMELGYSAVFLCGNPAFYQKLGFSPSAEHQIFHVNDPERNARWCMVRELHPGALEGVRGFIDIE